MATRTMNASRTASRGSQSVKLLQGVLVNLIDLSLQGKQAHWNVTGREFRSLHKQLDKMVEEQRAWSDEVAERIRSIDDVPDGRVATVSEATELDDFPAGLIGDSQVIALMIERLDVMIERSRTAMHEIGDSDLVSQDLLIKIAGGLEMQRWMLRAQNV